MTTTIHKGKILGFHGSYFSGLATLRIDDADRGEVLVPCDNGVTVRALESAFGNVVAPGHSVNPQGAHIGKEIFYVYDDFGLVLAGFVPADRAPVALVEKYEAQPKKEVIRG